MKFFTLCILLLLNLTSKAQLAIINDPDGFVNVREGKGTNTKIVGKLYQNQVFLYGDEVKTDEWIDVHFGSDNLISYTNDVYNTSLKTDFQGYIHRSRLLPIENLPHLVITQLTANKLVIKNDSIELTIKTSQFNIKNHKVHRTKKGCTSCVVGYVDKIDGKEPFGVDGGLPDVELSAFNLTINNIVVEIPRDSYNDVYQPRLNNLNVYFDNKKNIYLYMPGNSDGAGLYDVVWIINNRKLIKRYIDSID